VEQREIHIVKNVFNWFRIWGFLQRWRFESYSSGLWHCVVMRLGYQHFRGHALSYQIIFTWIVKMYVNASTQFEGG